MLTVILPLVPIMVNPLGLIIKLFVAKAPPASAKKIAMPVAGLVGRVAVTAPLVVLTPYLLPAVALKLLD